MINRKNCECLVIFVLSLYYTVLVHAEVFTAISDVEGLLETHQRIIDDVNFYIQSEEDRLNTLKKRMNIYMAEHEKAMEDVPNYLGNPINAFTLIKRLTKDLDFIEKVIQMGTVNVQNITLNHRDMKYPSYEDLTGAAQALMRLQETYNLDLHELSEGVLNGVAYSTPMSSEDCYELGITLFNDDAYKDALPWLVEARKKYQKESGPHHFTETDIVQYIGATHYYLGNLKIALELAKEALKMNPKHPLAAGNVILYQKAIAEQEAKELISQLGGEIDDETTKPPLKDELRLEYEHEIKDYEVLCRGEMEVPPALAKRLHCLYQTKNHPFLRLAPIKVEYVYLQPDIVIFHDVISDSEIKFIKEAAQPRFGRAKVQDAMTGELIPVNYRISKSAWLLDEESQVIRRVSRRVEDMTGLNVATAEDLQVVNYGIGGHYEPHFDFSRKHENQLNYQNNGNRIGTVLFYMSDVAQGGATVFTKLGLSLFPIKGAAAFWYNLHPSGEGDLATRHAACPVLRGSKWVSNKWLHIGGQEFLRPCNLEYQDECVLGKIHKPVRKALR